MSAGDCSFVVPDPRTQPTLKARELAALLGVGVDSIYDAVQRDELPVPVLRVGRRLIFPTQPALAALGLVAERDEAPLPGGAPVLTLADPPAKETSNDHRRRQT